MENLSSNLNFPPNIKALTATVGLLFLTALPVSTKYTPPEDPSRPKDTGTNGTRGQTQKFMENIDNYTPPCAPSNSCLPKGTPQSYFNFGNSESQNIFRPGFSQ